jgi:hypothetical protein
MSDIIIAALIQASASVVAAWLGRSNGSDPAKAVRVGSGGNSAGVESPASAEAGLHSTNPVEISGDAEGTIRSAARGHGCTTAVPSEPAPVSVPPGTVASGLTEGTQADATSDVLAAVSLLKRGHDTAHAFSGFAWGVAVNCAILAVLAWWSRGPNNTVELSHLYLSGGVLVLYVIWELINASSHVDAWSKLTAAAKQADRRQNEPVIDGSSGQPTDKTDQEGDKGG